MFGESSGRVAGVPSALAASLLYGPPQARTQARKGGSGVRSAHHRSLDGPDLWSASLRVISAGQAASGAFVASPTFSQYRYAWLRDGSFVAESLDLVGELERSARFHAWVAGIVLHSADGLERAIDKARRGASPSTREYLHCRYDVDGGQSEGEWHTFQLDGPGIWLWAVAHHQRRGGRIDPAIRDAVDLTARYLAALWSLPCADAWEESPEHVHTSTLAAIRAGLDAAVALAPDLTGSRDVAAARAAIGARLASQGGCHTKWIGNPAVDASLLWMVAPYGSVAPTEPRFAATLARIEDELIDVDGGVHRYRTDTFYGGGAWPVLTSAYGRVLLRRDGPGDRQRAMDALRWIEAQADPSGNLPEQVADRASSPDLVPTWRERWGESATPLLWSHAAYLALRVEIETFGPSSPST
jgi:GH15 family glucan-1,4-alpha-glucosidase